MKQASSIQYGYRNVKPQQECCPDTSELKQQEWEKNPEAVDELPN